MKGGGKEETGNKREKERKDRNRAGKDKVQNLHLQHCIICKSSMENAAVVLSLNAL